MGKTQDYYDKNPEAKARKLAYDKNYQKVNRNRENKKRSECAKFRRENGTYGNGSNMDCSHLNGTLIMEHRKKNRSRK